MKQLAPAPEQNKHSLTKAWFYYKVQYDCIHDRNTWEKHYGTKHQNFYATIRRRTY